MICIKPPILRVRTAMMSACTPVSCRGGTISADKFRELVAKATGFSPAILDGTLQAVTDELHSWLSEGWTVEVGELGYFPFR